MKKILSLIAVLLSTVITFAAEKTIWEGTQPISWNTDYFEGIQLDTYSAEGLQSIFEGLAKDDVIRLYIIPGSTDPQYAFRYKAGDDWSWTDLVMTIADGVASYTVESDEMATWIAERGLVVTGQDYTLTKITIEKASESTDDPFVPGENETVLTVASGSASLPLVLLSDWSAYTTFATTEFASAKAGDILTVYVQDVLEGAQISLKDMSDGWPALEESTAYPSVETTATTFTYTFTDETVEKVKTYGLVIGGQKLTVVRVTLTSVGGDSPEPEPEPVVYPITLWEGSQVIDWSGNPSTWQTITRDKFANVKAGDIIRFAYTEVKAGATMALQYSVPGNWAMVPGTDFMSVDGLAKRIDLTQEMLDAILSGDLHVTGIGFTLTLVEILDPATVKTLTCSVPVTGDDWIWTQGETPTFTINIQNDNAEAVTAKATLMLTTDKMVAVKNYEASKNVAANSNDAITFDITETLTPSFYRATVIVNDETIRAFNFGYAPTEISSPADKQADFESFWQTAKDELAAIEATDEPVLTKIESHSTENRTVYLVEFKSVSDGDGNPVTVRGYYAEPTDGKKHPVIMHYQGYDSGYRPGGQGVEPWCLNGDGDALSANYAEFILSTRGQSVNNRPAAERADGIDRDFTNEYGDWFAFNFGDKDRYYYRGAYMDVVRALDFMATRPTSDMTNLYAEGQSQGGAFTYAAAALGGYEFKAIAPGIAFMGDFPDYFELASWPASVARANQGTMTDAEMYAFLSYFDTKNLATLISSNTAVIATIGVQDNVCPPHTNIAPYNNLAEGTTKEISFNPENAHQVADNWYQVYMAYFASKYIEPEPEPGPEPGEKKRTENAQKLFDVLTSLYGNKIISGTTAFVDWNTGQAEQVHQWTNKYPAINTYDFINIHASKDVNPEGWLDYSDIRGVKNWAAEGGVVSAMWHWQVKNNAGTGYTCTPGTGDAATSFDASKVYEDGTAENILAKQQLNQVCGYLKKIQDAGIPVIWRPFHEAAGNTYEYDGGTVWFWWGAKGADVYKQLWQWMYNYMVNEQGLHNLIWVWTSQTKDSSWYPGNDYVDIIGRDIYGGQAAQQKSDFDHLTTGYPNMMVALSECGNTSNASQSDISAVWEAGAKWSWFSTWYDASGSQLHNTQDWWTNAFSQDYVVTRDQMKKLLDLNIEPEPEPEPEVPAFSLDGFVADEGNSYDASTYTLTVNNAWTGGQLWIGEYSTYSGSKLLVKTTEDCKLKIFVGYVGGGDVDMMDEEPTKKHSIALDNTKMIEKVIIQNQEATTITFESMELDPEEEIEPEPEPVVVEPLEEGEMRTLFEDEEGVVMAWNEICQMDAEWGTILEAGESFLVTVKSRTEGSEWPKVILRDATSSAVQEVELYDVTEFPYIVKIILADEMVAKLRDGFRFSGDGVTITKIELYKPAPVKEGDINIEALNWFRTAVYDTNSHTVNTTARWGQAGWQVGDDRYADKTLVIVNVEPTEFPVTLKMEYTNTSNAPLATSVGVAAGTTQLNLPLPLDTKIINKVYLTYSEAGSVVLTDASVIAAANARPLTGYSDTTRINTVEGYVNDPVDVYYNLNGQKVKTPTKGLYIVNGKKVVIK